MSHASCFGELSHVLGRSPTRSLPQCNLLRGATCAWADLLSANRFPPTLSDRLLAFTPIRSHGDKVSYPTCANDGCAKPGLHRCARCQSTAYCSAACQKVNWKQGGHKQACKAAATAVATLPTATATVASSAGGGEVGNTCTICLDTDPLPIQSGCACRGDAGLAHVECRAMAAAHLRTDTGKSHGWWKCATCGTCFTGAMELGLAETWWSKAQQLPEEDDQWMGAAENLVNALNAQGKHAEAAAMHRKVLAISRRVRGPEDPDTLATANNLALALDHQGKHVEATKMLREVLALRQRVLGPEHPDTLTTGGNLALALDNQGKHAEAETAYREMLSVFQRVLGPEHPVTLTANNNLAHALNKQGKFPEAKIMNREVLALRRRVLGPEHPGTLNATNGLASTLCSQGKFAEAATVYREVLAVLLRVLGPEHPSTLEAADNIAACSR
jgi:hypothetical protein